MRYAFFHIKEGTMRTSKCCFIFSAALTLVLFCTGEIWAQPAIYVNPTGLNFSGVGINCRLTKSFRIMNTGNQDLHITLSLNNNYFGLFSYSGPSTATIPQGYYLDVPVTFSPKYDSLEAANIQISSNAPSSPTTVFLTGDGYGAMPCTGQQGYLEIMQPNIEFNDVVIGYPEIKVVPLIAREGDVTLTDISIESSTCPGIFRWRLLRGGDPDPIELPFDLKAGLSFNLNAIFDPERAIGCDGLLTINTDSTETPTLTIQIQGSGVCFQTPPGFQGFEDVPCSHWAFNPIMSLYYATPRITNGCQQDDPVTVEIIEPDLYCADDSVTREQMAAFIIRALVVNGDLEAEPPADYCGTTNPFNDVSFDRWSCKYIKKLQELGLASGYGDGRFGPDDLVTREQMAAFLTRSLDEVPADGYCGTSSPFTDVSSDRWSCKYVKKLVELGITLGYGEGLYGPDDPVTRAQMAVFLKRAFLQDYAPG
jgi:hypothetical protein